MDACQVVVPIPRPRDGADEYYGASNDLHSAANAICASLPRGRTTATSIRAHSSRRAAKRGHVSRSLAIGAVLSITFTVVLVMIFSANGPAAVDHSAVSGATQAAQLELSNLATAEATYHATTASYTTDSNMLYTAGYRPAPGDKMAVFAGTDSTGGFCAGAGLPGSAAWVIYASSRGGFGSHAYPTKDAAQIACAAGASMWFDAIG